ncbi:putative aminomethyltransferase [Clavispora lusitaniae]|uniref:Aminomethyltransferase n=1 Tax=Clavispora lusitaniae TaxID=36911 RepID=A0AA91T417_CLALS|nr:Aminomethyltransferase, mitochondrial [Clavispora lusitaniae]OVF10909.1 putative aminomethyltransferase [Clavispora lusitaniae]
MSSMLRRFYSSGTLTRTPLYESHVKYGAKFVPYAGFEMPIMYKDQSHIESHNWVRSKVGLFDVSHMLQHRFHGADAVKFLQKITPIDLSQLQPFTSSLSVLLNNEGGIIDDTIITKHGEDKFYMVTNAGCREKDLAFIRDELKNFDQVHHQTFEGTLLAVQGPAAGSLMQKLTNEDLSKITFGQTQFLKLNSLIDSDIHLSRTGYTGEDGFELSIPSNNDKEAKQARQFFEALIDENPELVRPIGLAARDSLRLEAGMCLYGNELSEEITPVEASLSWLIPKTRRTADAGFNGSSKILKQLTEKGLVTRRRIGVISKGPAPRTGAKIVDNEGKQVGYITSGSLSPTLGSNVAQSYIDKSVKIGSEVQIDIRGKLRPGKVTKLPFVPNNFYRG